jgi:hypothetical protein
MGATPPVVVGDPVRAERARIAHVEGIVAPTHPQKALWIGLARTVRLMRIVAARRARAIHRPCPEQAEAAERRLAIGIGRGGRAQAEPDRQDRAYRDDTAHGDSPVSIGHSDWLPTCLSLSP